MIRLKVILSLCLVGFNFSSILAEEIPAAPEAARQEWKDDRFGMFIHWGPISQDGQGELSHSRISPSHRNDGTFYVSGYIDTEYYDSQYLTFDPVNFDADHIASVAKQTGMNYMVFTAKHHDGFSMYDTAQSDYNVTESPFGQDILGLLAEACPRNGVKFGFYYSPRDWYHPDCDSENHDRYILFYKAQLEELLSNYGPIYELWFDGLGGGAWGNTANEVMTRVRELHPEAMVNDRGGAGADFYTTEHNTSFYNPNHLWEACLPLLPTWGYVDRDYLKVKHFPFLMEFLIYTWGADGNMLLNIGPKGDGSINENEKERLDQIAAWWAVNGEKSIRASRGGPYVPGPWGASTYKENRIYLHVFRWPQYHESLTFPLLPGYSIESASVLGGGSLEVTQADDSFQLWVSPEDRNEIVTTIELVMDQPINFADPLFRNPNLCYDAIISSSVGPDRLERAVDFDANTSWFVSLDGQTPTWVQFDFSDPKTIEWINVPFGKSTYMPTNTEFQILNDENNWETVHTIDNRALPMKRLSEPVTAEKVRFVFAPRSGLVIPEFEVYGPIDNLVQRDEPPPPSAPRQIALWLDAEHGVDVSTDNSVKWADQSGSDNHLGAAEGAEPTLIENVLNGRDILRFDGVNDYLQSIQDVQRWPNDTSWIFFVCKNNSVGYNSLFRMSPEGNPGRVGVHLPYTDGGVYWDCGGVAGGVNRLVAPDIATDAYNIWAFVAHEGDSNERMEIWRDGDLKASQSRAVTLGQQGKFNLAWEGADSNYWHGDVAEILVINRDLSAEEHQSIGGYLANKYGLPSEYQAFALPTELSVSNLISENVSSDSAEISVDIDTGLALCQVRAYWGKVDGGEHPENWENEALVGSYVNYNGPLSFTLDGLAASTTYFYNFVITCGEQTIWASPKTLVTTTPLWDEWKAQYSTDILADGFYDDPDGDDLINGLEAIFGSHPATHSVGPLMDSKGSDVITFTHSYDPAFGDHLPVKYFWSTDLVNWYESGGTAVDGSKVFLGVAKTPNKVTVSASPVGDVESIFIRLVTSEPEVGTAN